MLDNKSVPGISKEVSSTNPLVKSYRTPELGDEKYFHLISIDFKNHVIWVRRNANDAQPLL